MKLVGGDSGRYEHETFIEEVLLAPSERAIVDVLFDEPGEVRLEHRTPDRTYDLGAFSVDRRCSSGGTAASDFDELRSRPRPRAEQRRRLLGATSCGRPTRSLAFVSLMPLLYGDDDVAGVLLRLPDAPRCHRLEPATCPKCGMKLVPQTASSYVCPMHPDVIAAEPGTCPKCGMKLVHLGRRLRAATRAAQRVMTTATAWSGRT